MPNNDESGNVSPPNNQPSTTAPGGVMSEILCSCATVRRGSNQYRSRNVSAEPITAIPTNGICFDFAERLGELNEELETLNLEAHILEQRISERVSNLLNGSD